MTGPNRPPTHHEKQAVPSESWMMNDVSQARGADAPGPSADRKMLDEGSASDGGTLTAAGLAETNGTVAPDAHEPAKHGGVAADPLQDRIAALDEGEPFTAREAFDRDTERGTTAILDAPKDAEQPEPFVAREVKQITMLMPVWGYQFVGRFLEFCLPTLLAPNNVPAVAQMLPCRFVLISSATDETIVRSHPAWQKLESVCTAEIHLIDDLITQGNHTATITLAFERVLRGYGEAMRDAGFIFLMSDYLIADGSLKTVVTKICEGASCLLAGNFQIIAEDAVPLLRQRIDPASHEIVLQPRDLIRWSLGHLHPATVANIVNFGLSHNDHTNRLFWRVDEETLIGRFYLMHPIAIHPEVSEFVIGASWDYSFVPELCPSGNVATLTDSDEYLVVELQGRGYEAENLRPGPINPVALGASLSSWATENHRRNVEQTLVFHAGDRPAGLPQAIAQSAAFVEAVRASLVAPAMLHREHPYWVGSIAVNRRRSNRPLSKSDWAFLLAEKGINPSGRRQKLFGSPPELTALHPMWPDYKVPFKSVTDALAANGRVLLVASETDSFAPWVARTEGDVITLNIDHLLALTRLQYEQLAGRFDVCLLLTGKSTLETSGELIEHIAPLLKAHGQLLILVVNSNLPSDAAEFSQNFASQAGRLLNQSVWIEDIKYVELAPGRQSSRNKLTNAIAKMRTQPAMAPVVGLLSLRNYLANLGARITTVPPLRAWSSLCVTLRASKQPSPYPLRFEQEAALKRAALQSASQSVSTRAAVPQEQEDSWEDLKHNPIWRADPAHTATALAGYRFITALMGFRHDVAELGCAYPLGTRLVLQQFKRIALFDPRQIAVRDLSWRFRDNWRFEARVHDILTGPLPRQVDSAYSIEFIKYFSRDEEDTFVRHLRESLSRDFDFVVIGSPCYRPAPGEIDKPFDARGGEIFESGHGAAADPIMPSGLQTPSAGSAGHGQPAQNFGLRVFDQTVAPIAPRIYRRTAAELKVLVERHFRSVFLFSQVGDTVLPGSHPNATHIFALGCGK
jgi:hypothetical protein